jgi:hypothetical protein
VPVNFPNPFWNPFNGHVQSCGLLIQAQHSALAEFPTATHSDWQWRDLLEPAARAFVLNDLPQEAEPLVEVIDQPQSAFRLGAVLEVRIGKGALVATSLDLDSSLSGRQLKRSLLDYLASDCCNPALQLTSEQAEKVLVGNRFQIVENPPANAQVMLDVEASANVKSENASSWKITNDKIVKQADGFSYDFPPLPYDPWKNTPQVSWMKSGHSAWMSHNFTLRIHCPADFSGTVYLQFRDADSGKAVAAVQSGRDACYVGPHGGAGKWVSLRVTPADLKDGELDITAFKPVGGDSWSRAPRITRLVIAASPLIMPTASEQQ